MKLLDREKSESNPQPLGSSGPPSTLGQGDGSERRAAGLAGGLGFEPALEGTSPLGAVTPPVFWSTHSPLWSTPPSPFRGTLSPFWGTPSPFWGTLSSL